MHLELTKKSFKYNNKCKYLYIYYIYIYMAKKDFIKYIIHKIVFFIFDD